MLQNLPKRRCALMNPCLALNRPWRPYMLCLSFVSQFPLGPRLRSRLLRPGGLRSHLFSPGGLRSRLFSPGGLRSCLLRLGTLLCWLCLGSWSRHFHMDLALRPSPGSTSAPPPSWFVRCLERLEAAPWGGALCHESCPCTPCYSPQEVTRSPHGLPHHTNGCTSPKTTFPITHCTDVSQLIALITQLIALVTNHTADCTNHTLHKPWTSSMSSPSIV